MSPEEKAAIVLAIRIELVKTAIIAARKIQRILERENRDLDLRVAVQASEFVSDFCIHLEMADDHSAIHCMASESPTAWLRECRAFVAEYRQTRSSAVMKVNFASLMN